ncbi:MAG: hypothetical protein V1701_00885 [Planctomycetota bacterium]
MPFKVTICDLKGCASGQVSINHYLMPAYQPSIVGSPSAVSDKGALSAEDTQQ